ncbi:MAG: hypothetical protein ACK5GN_00395, partial [Pseudomonadota bacterium]
MNKPEEKNSQVGKSGYQRQNHPESATAQKLSPPLSRSEDPPELKATAVVLTLLDRLPLSRQQVDQILPGRGGKVSPLVRFRLLACVESEPRMEFFRGVFERATNAPSELAALSAVVRRAGYYLGKLERADLAEEILELVQNKKVAHGCWLALARSSKSLAEAKELIVNCGLAELMRSREGELKEFVARVKLLQELRLVASNYGAKSLSDYPRSVNARQFELGRLYGAADSVLREAKWAKATGFYAHLSEIIREAKKRTAQINLDKGAPSDLAVALRDELARVRFTLGNGISLKESNQDAAYARGLRWSAREISLLDLAIEDFGVHELLTSGAVLSVIKTGKPGEKDGNIEVGSYCGSTKRIWLSPNCFVRKRDAYGNEQKPAVLMHELGHAASASDWGKLKANRPTSKSKISHLDFIAQHFFPSDLMRIGGWHTQTGRYQVDLEEGAVLSEGQWLPLKRPVDVQGQLRVYEYDQQFKILFYYTPLASKTPKTWYSRSDPAEWVAEGIAFYFSDPEVLISTVPRLFIHLDSIFHRYSRNKRLGKQLEASLSRSGAKEQRGLETTVRGDSVESLGKRIFNLLSPQEQREIIESFGERIAYSEGVSPAKSREIMFSPIMKRQRSRDTAIDLCLLAFSRYKPAFILSQAALCAGEDLMIVSMRGSTEREPDSQEPLRTWLGDTLGEDFDQKQVYFLNQHGKSHRLKGLTYHDRLQELISERLRGCSLREEREVKPHDRRYQKVIFYSSLWPTLDRIRLFREQHSLTKELEVIDTR